MSTEIDRLMRDFNRYTGDGLPGEPADSPLPIGDPTSGAFTPKKKDLRDWGDAIADATAADRVQTGLDRIAAAASAATALGVPYGSIIDLASTESTPDGWYTISATSGGIKTITNKPYPMVLRFDTSKGVAGLTIGVAIAGIAAGKTVTVDWGDALTDDYTTTGTKTHTYAAGGVYDVRVSGEITAFGSSSAPTGYDKLIEVVSFSPSITNYDYAFSYAVNLTSVTGYIGSAVTSMYQMFRSAPSLTTMDVSGWDVSSVTSMSATFYGASSLTTMDVSGWDVSSVVNMDNMFYAASSLTALDVSGWDVSSVVSMISMFRSASLTTGVYDATLIAWDALTVVRGLKPNFGSSKYTAGGAAETARSSLISNDSWTITDGGPV